MGLLIDGAWHAEAPEEARSKTEPAQAERQLRPQGGGVPELGDARRPARPDRA